MKKEKNTTDKPVEPEKEIDSSDKARLISISEAEPEVAPSQVSSVAPVPATPVPAAPVPAAPVPAVEVKTPEAEASLFDLSDPTTPAMDKNNTPAMDDLFGLGDLSLDGSVSPQVQATPVASGILKISTKMPEKRNSVSLYCITQQRYEQ